MSYLTQDDRANFGDELIDLSMRAARHALTPEMARLQEDNERMRMQLAREVKRNLDQALDAAGVPWREVDRSPRWLAWLQGRDPLSAQTRKSLLDAAVARADARAVIALFQAFLQEEGAPGQPGQAGSRPAATGNQIYTRQQILQMARQRQKGLISDEQWRRWEFELCRASAEGRVVGALSLTDGVPVTR